MVNIVLLLAACSTLIGDFYGAIVANDIAAVRELLEQGQDPNEPQDGIHSPFEYAKTVERNNEPWPIIARKLNKY